MSWWNRDVNTMGADAEDLAYPPSSGGIGKMLILGFGAAGYLLYLAVTAWLEQRIWWPGSHGSGGIWLVGKGARSLAVSEAGAALFCHARWFWGLRYNEWMFEKLSILGGLAFGGGILGMFWFEFFI